MQIQKSLLLTLVLGATSALSAQTTLLNDNFSSGPTGYLATSGGINQNSAGGVQAPPASSFWYANSSSYSFSSGPGGSPITYTQNVGISLTPNTTQAVTTYFEPVDSYSTPLSTVGDTITLSMNFTVGTWTGFKENIAMDLLNSGSSGATHNQLTTNSGNTTTLVSPGNYTGYMAEFDAAASTTTSGILSLKNRVVTTSNTSFISSAPPTIAGFTAPTTTPGLNATDTYKASLAISKAAGGTNVSFSLTDVTDSTQNAALAIYNSTILDTLGGLPTTFDGFSLGTLNGSGGTLTITNAAVVESGPDFAAIPEPSTYAAVLGAATLGFVLVRSRRQRRQQVA